jgi:hypothetical protein
MRTLILTAIRCMHHIPGPRLFRPLVRRRVESVALGFAMVLGVFFLSGSEHVFAQPCTPPPAGLVSW